MTFRSPALRQMPAVFLSKDFAPGELRDLTRDGRLLRVRPGAYIQNEPELPPWRQEEGKALARCLAMSQQLTCEYAFSHVSAALLHGCALWELGSRTHITQVVNPSAARASDVRRHCATLPPEDTTVVGDLRVTTLERTIVDCARSMHPRDALVIVDSAMRILTKPDRRDRAGSRARLRALRHRLLQRLTRDFRGRGVARARAVISAADAFAESPGETVLRWIAVSRGLPPPVSQLRVATFRGTFFTDLGWSLRAHDDAGRTTNDLTIHAEFDGRVKYTGEGGDSETLVREKVREDAIREASGVVLRFVTGDLHQQEETFRRLCRPFPAAIVNRARPVPALLAPVDRIELQRPR